MKNIWKGLIGLGILLLGLALWIAGSIFEGIAGGLAGESWLLTKVAMGIGFLLFSNQEVFADLCKLGVTPSKSFTLKYPEIPPQLHRHFIRGVFDGDGCVSISEREGHKTPRLRVAFTSASQDFLVKVNEVLHSQANTTLRNLLKYGNAHRLIYLTPDCLRLFVYLYEDVPSSMYMERKFYKFVEWIRTYGGRYRSRGSFRIGSDSLGKLLQNTAKRRFPKRDSAIILLLEKEGLSCYELAKAGRKDVDLLNKTLLLESEKGKRSIEISEESTLALEEHLPTRNDKVEPLFLGAHKSRLSANGIRFVWEDIAEASNLKESTPEILKHSFICQFLVREG